jgi:PiT family inorganic phosphate transporter
MEALFLGLVIATIVYFLVKLRIKTTTKTMSNNKAGVNKQFTIPLIFAAALLSFAHGANDVANAVGPLAAIYDATGSGGVNSIASIPLWIMMIGAIGIAIGLALYGPKLIRTVGSKITELDQMRSFSIVMAAAITVIIASQLGLPVSSTHIAVGGIFGVGFLREYIKSHYRQLKHEVNTHHAAIDESRANLFIEEFEQASFSEKRNMILAIRQHKQTIPLSNKERKKLKKRFKTVLVKRQLVFRIAGAWLITVPVSGVLAALIFFTIRGMLIPLNTNLLCN